MAGLVASGLFRRPATINMYPIRGCKDSRSFRPHREYGLYRYNARNDEIRDNVTRMQRDTKEA